MNLPALAFNYVNPKTHHHFHLPLAIFKMPENDEEYIYLENFLDQLIDEIKGDEDHPLALAMRIIGENLERYDDTYHPPIGSHITEIDLVKYLMKIHHLYQKDLADIFGSQANVSKFLKGERALGKTAIAGIKNRFGISADFFL